MEIPRTSLIRDPYRHLLSSRRTYAGFTSEDQELLKLLPEKAEILDPMSGYGLLTAFCAKRGCPSFCLEMNPPQFLWQVLCHPRDANRHADCVSMIRQERRRWPSPRIKVAVSNDWFPAESVRLLLELLQQCTDVAGSVLRTQRDRETFGLALLLPFTGRFSTATRGDVSAYTKKGGTCIYLGWRKDFLLYLDAVDFLLSEIRANTKCTRHELNLGDAQNFPFPKYRFHAMVTSPPYPNHRNFASMFAPENAFLSMIKEHGSWMTDVRLSNIIGTNAIEHRCAPQVRVTTVQAFLERVSSTPRSKQAKYDDDVYYFPYFRQYFSGLEVAYANTATALAAPFKGFITVVNNTHRGIVIPVSETVREIWSSLGYEARVFRATENFHVGTKNPRARGIRAKHTEYVIEVTRR